MAVLCKDVSFSAFNEKHVNVYKYEVLGGMHSFRAKYDLMKDYPENPFFSEALAEAHIDLSDEQALRLAQRHNANSHYIHKITHRDLVCTYVLCSYVEYYVHACTYVILVF